MNDLISRHCCAKKWRTNMKLVDLEGFKFDLSGLAYILPTDVFGIGEYFMRQLRDLPSAQPESIWLPLTESDIDHLFDYYAKEKDENLTDRAQELKEAMWVGYMAAKNAQPERKTGEWYRPAGMMPPEYAGVYRCSECDEIAMRDYKTHKQILTDFCPNCGADMRCSENPNSWEVDRWKKWLAGMRY